MISLDKCSGSCNAVDYFSTKTCERNFNSTTCNSNQKWNNDTCQCECKKCRTCKKDYSWNPSTCMFENSRYLKRIVDVSVIVRDKLYQLYKF